MSEVSLGDARPVTKRRAPLTPQQEEILAEAQRIQAAQEAQDRAAEAEAADTRSFNMTEPTMPDPVPELPGNPYAPTGWGKKHRTEFDVQLPSGQLCRVMRLERDDLLRLNLLEYLDTFTPLLLDQAMSDAEREAKMADTVKENPGSLSKLFDAVDRIVMAATVKPKIVEDESKANYGTEKDWANPNFVPIAFLGDIETVDRMVIFAASFGRKMDDLKSLWPEA